MEKTEGNYCRLQEQGYKTGSCKIQIPGGHDLACRATLKKENNAWLRLITSFHLSRPENYLSIYQSGCNFSCRKCHSWSFSKRKQGDWFSPRDVLKEALAYEKKVTLWEPREKATAWHAHDTCICCGSCKIYNTQSSRCPGGLSEEIVIQSSQGWGPARNIVGFTGGDLICQPEFYGECARLIKAYTKLWVLIETNGYGLTPKNLDYLRDSGVDSFWLDIKAHDSEKHKWLTGCSNESLSDLPFQVLNRGFVLEVLSLYIPDVIETDELVKIALVLKDVDPSIPFTILAFFPKYKMKGFRSPTAEEMVQAYQKVKSEGLLNVRLGNLRVFVHSYEDVEYLCSHVDPGGF